VSKLAYQPSRSGKNPGWIKVKCRAWREANKDRWVGDVPTLGVSFNPAIKEATTQQRA
jgi:hypothetical protein